MGTDTWQITCPMLPVKNLKQTNQVTNKLSAHSKTNPANYQIRTSKYNQTIVSTDMIVTIMVFETDFLLPQWKR